MAIFSSSIRVKNLAPNFVGVRLLKWYCNQVYIQYIIENGFKHYEGFAQKAGKKKKLIELNLATFTKPELS